MTTVAKNASPQPSLPLSKLRGLSTLLRVALKARRITNCDQLLAIAATAASRRRLCAEAGLDEDELLWLVRRADMARINGIGAVFGMMLEELGIMDMPALAAADPAVLHGRLRSYNEQERIARRSPTPEEVESWVAQARRLPRLVS
ncbi:MAG TPA: DUF4332 domain-containing protein [Geminicoccaceae bacterium]|nr:DUF4332 domain-containing protein [Geminicoccus sp.]HMU52665.1 DUF4332 domain-containing protein [Geminicoccaceae bacterium]